MEYNEFTFPQLQNNFGIVLQDHPDLFGHAKPRDISDLLRNYLNQAVPTAVANGTEKARSEMIITPILLEVRGVFSEKAGLFSGVEFSVDAASGLRGVCDFLFSLSPQELVVSAPVVAIVEAKNDNIKNGLAQCMAEMIAAQRFNAERGAALPSLFGVVTTGSIWKFMRLHDKIFTLDTREYYLNEVEKIVGVLVFLLETAARGADARTSS